MKRLLRMLLCVAGIFTYTATGAYAATLPAGYTELGYIHFNGTSSTGAYIDTGLKYYTDVPTDTVKLVVDAKIYEGSGWQVALGNHGSVGPYVGVNPSNIFYYSLGSGDISTGVRNNYHRSLITADIKKGTLTILDRVSNTNVVNLTGITGVRKTTASNIYLGAFVNASSVSTMRPERAKMDLYSAQIWNNGTLVRDLVPAKRNSDDAVGMYDIVNNRFYVNSGSEELKAGSIVSVPADYEELEYITSNSGSYVETRISFDYAQDFRVIGNIINPDVSLRKVILGNYNGAAAPEYSLELGGDVTSKPGYFRVWSSSGANTYSTSPLPANTLITYDSSYVASTHRTSTSMTYGSTSTSFNVSVPSASGTLHALRFFLDYRTPNTVIANPLSIGRTKIYQGGTLVGDFVPARNISNEQLGFYNMVDGLFYAGTGTFTAGPAAVSGIKIATVNYTNNEFAPLETRLQVVTSRVGSIVSETATQASSIGTLLSNKQNRPNSSCPTGSKCLLVKDVNGNENWYPIVEAPSE